MTVATLQYILFDLHGVSANHLDTVLSKSWPAQKISIFKQKIMHQSLISDQVENYKICCLMAVNCELRTRMKVAQLVDFWTINAKTEHVLNM